MLPYLAYCVVLNQGVSSFCKMKGREKEREMHLAL
jgi:hypothetical protein